MAIEQCPYILYDFINLSLYIFFTKKMYPFKFYSSQSCDTDKLKEA